METPSIRRCREESITGMSGHGASPQLRRLSGRWRLPTEPHRKHTAASQLRVLRCSHDTNRKERHGHRAQQTRHPQGRRRHRPGRRLRQPRPGVHGRRGRGGDGHDLPPHPRGDRRAVLGRGEPDPAQRHRGQAGHAARDPLHGAERQDVQADPEGRRRDLALRRARQLLRRQRRDDAVPARPSEGRARPARPSS